jgi:hypothetical protein
MNTGNALGTDTRGVIAQQTIFDDQSRPSRLEVDVPASRDVWELNQAESRSDGA